MGFKNKSIKKIFSKSYYISMSFNRLKYDSCAYSKELQESINPLDYNLFKGKYESCKQCPVGSFTNNLEFGSKTNVESDLLGLTREQSKCPEKYFDPKKQGPTANFSPGIMCQSIYNITPTNMKMPTSNGLSDLKLGTNCCSK